MKPTVPSRRRSQEGSSLVVALVLTMIGAGLCAAMMTSVTSRATLTRTSRAGMSAMEVADSGLALARAELCANKDFDGGGIGTVAGTLGTNAYAVTCDAVDASHYMLRSTGRQDIARRTIESLVEVTESSSYLFGLGAFGDHWVTITGGTISDAFDSDLGPYITQAVNLDGKGLYASWGSPVGSNGWITVSGTGTYVRGDVTPGTTSTVSVNGGGGVDGSTAPRKVAQTLGDIDTSPIYDEKGNLLPSAVAYNTWPKLGKVTFSGNSVTVGLGGILEIPAGDHYLANLKVSNGGILKVNGNVRLFIGNELDATGGSIVNASQVASQLQIFGLADDSLNPSSGIHLSTKLGLFAAVYAPKTAVTLNGGGFFCGAIVSRTLKETGGSAFHYDQALAKVKTGVAERHVKQMSWRRAATPEAHKEM